jgi:hypothetical protein
LAAAAFAAVGIFLELAGFRLSYRSALFTPTGFIVMAWRAFFPMGVGVGGVMGEEDFCEPFPPIFLAGFLPFWTGSPLIFGIWRGLGGAMYGIMGPETPWVCCHLTIPGRTAGWSKWLGAAM